MLRSSVSKRMGLCLKPKREFPRSILLNSRMTFRNGFIPPLRRLLYHGARPEPIKSETPQSSPRQTGGGHGIAAMKDLTIFTKLLIFGIIVIIGVAFAFVRSR